METILYNYDPSTSDFALKMTIFTSLSVIVYLAIRMPETKKNRIRIIVFSFICALGMWFLTKHFEGQRFTSYNPETGIIKLVNGDKVHLSINDVRHFWPVTDNRSGECYLWIQMKNGPGFSSSVVWHNDNKCKADAAFLKSKYKK